MIVFVNQRQAWKSFITTLTYNYISFLVTVLFANYRQIDLLDKHIVVFGML